MKKVNFKNFLFRSSATGALMTDPKKGSSEVLSETTKAYLFTEYIKHVYGREDEIKSKYLEKGTQVEEDSITLISRVNKKFYKKNDEKLAGQWQKGTPDLFDGDMIIGSKEILDAKSSWDVFTFHDVMAKPVNKTYYGQGHSYMDLANSEKFKLCYCLVNTPAELIDSEKRKFMWANGIIDATGNAFATDGFRDIEKRCIYDIADFMTVNPHYDLTISPKEWIAEGFDIPYQERYFAFQIERDDNYIKQIHTRVEAARDWLQDFHDKRGRDCYGAVAADEPIENFLDL